jgi:hypothetical protein
MSILLDHCVPNKFLHLLTSWGYNATLLSQHIPPDSDDSDVLELAQLLDAVLLTLDLDFSNILTYPPSNYAGILVMLYKAQDEPELIITLQKVLADMYRDDLRGVLIIIEAKRYRVRR